LSIQWKGVCIKGVQMHFTSIIADLDLFNRAPHQ